mgnify:CR=1 FL=1
MNIFICLWEYADLINICAKLFFEYSENKGTHTPERLRRPILFHSSAETVLSKYSGLFSFLISLFESVFNYLTFYLDSLYFLWYLFIKDKTICEN